MVVITSPAATTPAVWRDVGGPGQAAPGAAIEVGELYRALSARLEQIVRLDVRAPDPVIEDACQFAWSRLVHHAGRVRREAVLAWLVKTAVREAFKLIRRDGRELSLDAALETMGDAVLETASTQAIGGRAPTPHEILEHRERLHAIHALPERQQRLLWLHALGLSYAEMALYTGCTPRTVERQLLRAKQRLREAR
jgi:RNA polymerase sigma factor (sigma-70 family)